MGNTGGTGKGSLWARGREDGLWSTRHECRVNSGVWG